MLYTDGVNYLAENASCFWLLDIIGTEIHPLQKKEPFLSICVVVADSKADIKVHDGNGINVSGGVQYKYLYERHIPYTDMPPGEWRFFLTNDVLMVPSEY